MKYFKVIITLLLIFAISSCLFIPSFAIISYVPADLSTYLSSAAVAGTVGAIQYLDTVAGGGFAGSGFGRDDLNTAYNTYVTALPSAGFGRDGASDTAGYLTWSPVCSFVLPDSHDTFSTALSNPFNGVLHLDLNYGSGTIKTSANVLAPISGHYYDNVVSSNGFPSSYYSAGYTGISAKDIESNFWNVNKGSGKVFSKNSVIIDSSYGLIAIGGPTGDYSFSYNLSFKVIPSDSSVVSTSYPTSSRVNTVINNYAIKNDNNTYNYITNKPIFDENTLVFYDPLTGVSFNVTGWYYDYSTRRYVLTYTDDSSTTLTSTVEYGDDNITVSTGTTTNNYYYTVPGCQHTYVVTSSLAPTCTAPGSKTYTCSKCGDSYSETVPALGHKWVKGETVATTYESDGTTVKTRGYTLYTCSRCGEQYFDYDGTGPPSTTETSTPTLNWLQRIYYKLVDILNAVLGIDTSVTVDTASGTDIKVTVPGENGADDQQFSLKDFKAKFGWIHEIHTIISTFVSDVTSDSENAYAMAATSSAASADGSDSGVVAAAAVSSTGSTSVAPSIVIDFSKAQSVYGYDYGGQSEVLDLSWYSQYKPTVDAILSGFLWLLFLWGLFKHAPGIVTGGDVMENQIVSIKRGHKF